MPVIFVYLLYTVCTKTCKSHHVNAGFTTLIVAICKHYDLSVLFYLYYKEKIYELRQFEKKHCERSIKYEYDKSRIL